MSKKTNKRNAPKVAKKPKLVVSMTKDVDAIELLNILERIRDEGKVAVSLK